MEFNAIYVIVAREFKKFVRERSRLVSAIARPLVWLFLVGAGMSRLVPPVDGVSYMQFIFPKHIGNDNSVQLNVLLALYYLG